MNATQYENGGTLVGMFVGLVLGVVLAALVVWYMNNMPTPFVDKGRHAAGASANQAPISLPGKPGDPVPDGERFQFYKILPGKSEAVPANTPAAAAQTPDAAPTPPAAAPEKSHYLQAGSFSNPQEADNLKAMLAMNGYEANVQQVMVQHQTFYRLRLGPYTNKNELDRMRAELAKSGVNTIPVDRE
jgi:cell division protein FtsN